MRAFTHARVIDGRGGFIPDGTVVVDGSTIVNVGAASGVEILEGTEIIDCGGRTLMPGLMDAHTHLETTASNNVINEVAQYIFQPARCVLTGMLWRRSVPVSQPCAM